MIATDGLDLFDSLGSLADLAGRATQLDEVLDRAVSIIADVTGAQLCVIANPAAAAHAPAAISAISPTHLDSDSDSIDLATIATWISPIVSRVSDASQPLLIQTPEVSDPELRMMLNQQGLASAVAVPVLIEAATPLVLVALSAQTNGFTNADLGFMSSTASVLSLAGALHRASNHNGDHGDNQPNPPSATSESETRRAERMAGLGAWELNLTSGALHWTDTMYRLLGLSVENTTPTQELFDSLVDPRDGERLRDSLTESSQSDRPGSIEYRITRADGTTRWLRQEHELIGEGSSSPSMVGMVHDVTLQREAAEKTRRSDERLRAVLHVSETGIAIAENDGRAIYRNRTYTELLGHTSEEMEHLRLEDLAIEPDQPRLTELRRRLRDGETHVAVNRPVAFIRPDGTTIYLAVSVTQSEAGGQPFQIVNLQDMTARVVAERQAEEREIRFQSIFETASSGFLILDADGTPQTANQAFLDIYGLEASELQNRPPQDFIVSEQQAADVAECIDRHLHGQQGSCDHTLEIKRQQDGTLRRVRVTCQTLFTGNQVRGVLAEFTDLTETLAAQQALQESERRLLEAEQVARLGHWEWEVGSNTISASDRISALLGGGADSGRFYERYTTLLAPEDRDRVQAASKAAFADGASFDLQYTILPPGAEPAIVHEVMRVEFDDDGNPQRAFGTVQDVTVRVTAEQALAESESRLRAILEASPNGISFFSDPESPPFRNRAFAEMLGYTLSEMDALQFAELLPPNEDQSWLSELWEHIEQSEPARDPGLAHFVHKDGHILDVDIRISDVVVDGKVIGHVADVRDVTTELANTRALEESEARARLVFDSASSGMLLMRLNGEIQLANQAFCDIIGTTIDDVTQFKVHRIIDRRDVGPMFALFRSQLNGHTATRADLRVRLTRLDDGRIRTLRVDLRPFIENGQVAGMLADVRDITERLETRIALIESQARLRRAQTNAHIGGWELDIPSNELRWSDELYQLFDLEPGAIEPTIGAVLHGVHKDDRARFIESFEQTEQGNDSLDLRMRFTGTDGTHRVIWSRGDLIRDGQGEPLRWEGTSQDITELAGAQEALAESEARLNAAQASAQIGSWSRPVDTDETYWSDQFWRLLGMAPGEVTPTRDAFRSFVHPDDVDQYSKLLADLDSGKSGYETQVRLIGADGIHRLLGVRADLVHDQNGELIRWEGTAQDITERAAAQEALAESESRLNLAQSLSHVGSWGRRIAQGDGYWSDEFFRLLGLEPGSVSPSPGQLRKHVHPDDLAIFEAATEKTRERNGYDVQIRVIGADGVERVLAMHGELTLDEDNNPLRLDGTGQDVTELVAAQQALAESTARLELAQSQAHVGSFGRNLSTGEVYWSDELYRLYGYEPNAVEPGMEHVFRAMHEDDREQFSKAVRAASETKTDRYDVRSRITRIDGSERIIWQHGELTRDQHGKPLRWDGTAQDITELEQAQHALAEREEFLRTTLDAVRSGVMVVNPQRKIISANGNASQIMGYSAGEFLNAQLEDVVHGEDLALMLGRFAARVRGEGGPERTIVRAQRKDGAEISLDVRGAPLVQSSELQGIVVDFRDVTEELAVQHRLEDTATRLRTLFETVRSGLMVLGPDLIPITCNEALASMFGSSVDQLLSQPIDAFLLPEERQIVAESIEAQLRDEVVPGRIPSAIIRADGTRREVDVKSTPFVVDGKPIGILCELRDVTEELALQEEVQDTAERLNTVFETVSTGLIIVGLDQQPLTVNQALCDILGYSRDELMQKTLTEITHPDDVEFLLERFAHRIGGGTTTNRREIRALRADGATIHVDISAEPFRIGGEVIGVLGEVRDITEALALQQEVEHTAERLNTVFESVSTGLAIVGPDRRPLTVNQALTDITGFSRAELLSMPFEQNVHPDEVQALLDRFANRISGELNQRDEYQTRLIRKNGDSRDISVSAEPFHIGGQFVGVLAEIRDITEERSLQRQVQETADRLNNVFESVSTGLLVIDPDRRPLTVNQALCEITGYSQQQLLGSTFDALIHEDDLPMVIERFGRRLDGDSEPFHIQARTTRQDGQIRVIDISAEPFRVGGEIVGVLAEVRDITEDLELQHRVQDTADRLNNVFESVSTGLAVIGPDRVPHTMNQAFRDILGRTEEDLSSAPFDRLIHEDDLDLILERTARRFAGEEVTPHHTQVRVIRGDGAQIDIDLSAGPFVVAGETIGLLAEIRDITEELSLQALVTESAEQINTILEATPDAIVVADDNNIILRVNAATEKIFGSDVEELIGQSVTNLVGGVDREPHSRYIDHYKRTGLPSTEQGLIIGNFREAIGQRRDGSEFPAELAIAETELNDGRKLFVAAIRDITERKQAEKELQQLNAELETRSQERQALVQQLLSAQEEERRTVAYEIHDGPAQQLAAAQMFLEAFAFDQDIDLEAPSTEHFRRAKSYLDSGLTETRRIMSGLRPALLDDLGLSDALHQLLTELTQRAGIQLELDSDGLTDTLSPAIEITLYRIAQEAATNSLKHSGSDRLIVKLRSDGASAHLSVMDHGHGFNPEMTQGPKDGRRYGLVGMRERVELLQGLFEIDSTEGRGTTIRATIPLNQERG